MDIGTIPAALFSGAAALVSGYALGCVKFRQMRESRDHYKGECVAHLQELAKSRTHLDKLSGFIVEQRESLTAQESEITQYIRLLNAKEPARGANGRFISKVQEQA